MASRNIASMHLFLEMKKKFPDLPEDTLRNYACLYAQDQEKCVDILQIENRNHFHPRSQFSDVRLSDSKPKLEKSDVDGTTNVQHEVDTRRSSATLSPNNNSNFSEYLVERQDISPPSSTRSSSHAGLLQMPSRTSNLNVSLQTEAKSAPIMSDNNSPFTEVYRKSFPLSSQTHDPSRMMFSTTQEHRIVPVETRDQPQIDLSERHAVRLNITPSFPFSQQQMSVHGTSVASSASHPSKPGRHTTSVNFQLQPPHAGEVYPVEIATVPTNIGSPCSYRDFGSHLQISVGAQGATFTALRLQRPQSYHQSHQVSIVDQSVDLSSELTSQARSSVLRSIPLQPQPTPGVRIDDRAWNADEGVSVDQNVHLQPMGGMNSRANFMHGFQASPDYIVAVKKHQLARLELVLEELDKEKTSCSALRQEVDALERQLSQRRERENSLSYAELLKKLEEENRKLQIECNCLLMEYDLNNKGQIPVGVTDEDFYSNIFTGPNDGLTLSSSDIGTFSKEKVPPRERSAPDEDDEDERNRWKCKSCTFANHPALEKCEMCELPKNSGFLDCSTNFSSTSHLTLVPSSEATRGRRAVGSVQISVTRRLPRNPKSVKLHLTRRLPR